MKINYKKQGISLIVIVITIIVIVIIAGAVILTLFKNNPINAANEAIFKSDLDAIESDLNLYLTSQYVANNVFDPDDLNANELSAEYKGVVIPDKTIKDIIPVLSSTNKYDGQFEVVNGKLIYVGTDRSNKKWSQDINIEVIDADRLDAIIFTTNTLPISAGTDFVATIKISSNASIDNINLNGNLELLDVNNAIVPVQPIFEISDPSGSETSTLRNVDVTIKTGTLEEGTYKLKLKSHAISNIYNVKNETDIITGELFEVDNTPPTNPVMSASPTGWTNGDVAVTITYPSDAVVKECSTDGITWNTYTSAVVVSTNGKTVYARAADIAGNQSGQSTMTIANIDKESPTVTFGTNGGDNLQTASSKITISDIGVSGVDITSLKYLWDIQNVNEPTGEWTAFSNGETINKSDSNGTYYLWVKALDNAGNNVVTKSNVFIVDNIVPQNPIMSAGPTGWTNGDVAVTITYSDDAAAKEYSIDGENWIAYTSAVVVSTNGTTVYARATDASGNQSGQGTLTILNIDKIAPTVIYGTNGGTNLQTASTLVTASDLGGSNLGTLQYVWETQNTTNPNSGWVTFTNNEVLTKTGVNGTYYLWVKATDDAGNSFITKSSPFEIDVTPPTNPVLTASPTGSTNGNVTVTITYPSDAVVKECSTDGTTWNTYTSAVVVSTNGTTIYAKARDASGNQSGQGTLTITNIDKNAPSAPTFMGMTYSDGITNYINDTWASRAVYMYGGISGSTDVSGINRYQISTDNVNWVDYAYNYTLPIYGLTADGTYYRYARAVDNAGNIGSSYYRTIKIDATKPTNALISNLAVSNKTVTATVSISDTGGSGINLSNSKYIVSSSTTVFGVNDAIWNTASSFTSLSQNISTTITTYGNNYIQVLSTDNAGNKNVNMSSVIYASDGLIGRFSFSNSIINEINSRSYSATGISYVTGKVGNAISIMSGQIKVPLSDLGITSSTNAITTTFWFKWNGENNIMPIGFRIYDTWITGGLFGFNTAQGDVYGINNPFTAGVYTHVALIFYKGNYNLNSIYINGIKQTLSQKQSSQANANTVFEGNLNISGWDTDNVYSCKGSSIDELKVYNRALTDSEVAQIANQ